MVETAPARDTRSGRARQVLFIVAGAALGFLVGFGWQWFEARGYRIERDEAVRELEFQRLATTLASAVIEADRGSYEGARELSSRFFTGLQTSVGLAEPQTAAELRDILTRRDAVITALSRSDPASEDVLTRMFVRYQVATGGEEIGLAVPAAGPGEGPDATGGDTSGGAPPGGS